MKSLFTLLLVFISINIYCQWNSVDTVDYYRFSSLTSSDKGYFVEGIPITKEKYIFLSKSNDKYDSVNGMRYVNHKNFNSLLLFSSFEIDQELGPFGELKTYYSNGKLQSIYHFQTPNDSSTNSNIPEGTWFYLNNNGDTVGIKQYKNGLADGVWVAKINDTTIVEREYKEGLSHGTWRIRRFYKSGGEGYRDYKFYNGFLHSIYLPEENFETFLDQKENVYHYQNEYLILEEVEYGENREFINKGKFYVLKDGIKIELKEYKNRQLTKRIKYDNF